MFRRPDAKGKKTRVLSQFNEPDEFRLCAEMSARIAAPSINHDRNDCLARAGVFIYKSPRDVWYPLSYFRGWYTAQVACQMRSVYRAITTSNSFRRWRKLFTELTSCAHRDVILGARAYRQPDVRRMDNLLPVFITFANKEQNVCCNRASARRQFWKIAPRFPAYSENRVHFALINSILVNDDKI